MKKEELMKLEGMTETLATAILGMVNEETKDMIPRTRLNEVIAERDNARNESSEIQKQLNDLKKSSGNAEELQAQITKLQNDAKTAETTHAAEIKALKISNAVDFALSAAKAKNLKAAKALLNLDGAELADDGTVKGLAEQIKALSEAEDSKFLFGAPAMKGAQAGESGDGGEGRRVDTSKMNYTELAAYMEQHPEFHP